jgi:hypothetical protein
MDLAVFKKEELSYGMNIPKITKVMDDGSFYTRSLSIGLDNFGRNLAIEYFHRIVDPNKSQPDLIKPKTDYEMFELTTDPMEASIIAIDYYMGTEYKRIVKPIEDKRFIVQEKLQVKTRIPAKTIEEWRANGEDDKYEPFYDNTILKYRGIQHHEKETPKYEGDCNTEILLHNDCKFVMYKFIGIRKMV